MKMWYLYTTGVSLKTYGDHSVEQNNPGSERQISHVLPLMWNLKKMTTKSKGGYYRQEKGNKERDGGVMVSNRQWL